MTMTAWKLTAGSLALTAVLAATLPVQAQAPAPIKIGASMSLTGTYAKPGSYQKEGYDICAEEVNAKGGLLESIRTKKQLDDDLREQLKAAAGEFKGRFTPTRATAAGA